MAECVRVVKHYCSNPKTCPVRLVDRIPPSQGGDEGSVPSQGTNSGSVAPGALEDSKSTNEGSTPSALASGTIKE